MSGKGGGPQRYLYVVYNRAADGREEDFDRWYRERHLADLLAVEGLVSAQRFVVADEQLREPPSDYKHAVVIEIETDDIAGVMAEWKRRLNTPEMPGSDTAVSGLAILLRPIMEPLLSEP